MTIREKLNQNRPLSIGVSAVIAVFALFLVLRTLFAGGNGSGDADHGSSQVYFTSDISSQSAAISNLIAIDRTEIPPLQKDGKTLYRVHVYSSDGGKTKIVGYYERYTEPAKRRVEEVIANSKKRGDGESTIITFIVNDSDRGGIEVQFPGFQKWVDLDTARGEISNRLSKLGPGVKEIFP